MVWLTVPPRRSARGATSPAWPVTSTRVLIKGVGDVRRQADWRHRAQCMNGHAWRPGRVVVGRMVNCIDPSR